MKFKIKKFLIVLTLFLITAVLVFAQTSPKQSHPASEIEAGTLTGDYSIDGKLGIGTTIPESSLHIKSDASDNLLALEKSSIGKWNFDYVSKPDSGISSALKISSDNSPLGLYLPDEPGGMRMYLWGSRPVPNLPHTGIKPTFAVYGDILVGDILAIERNPMEYFLRVESDLPASSSTNLFSSRKGLNDIDGGAHIRMLPDDKVSDYSGSLKLIAYGQGTGYQANSIHFMTRSGINSVISRAWINNQGLYVNGKITATGGVDPPYVSYSGESHDSIREFAKDVEDDEEVMMFWNAKAHRIEVYDISEDRFYTITGELIS